MLCKRGDLKKFSGFTNNTRSSLSEVFGEKIYFAKFTEKRLCLILYFNKVAGRKPENVRSSHWRWSVKKVLLKGALVFQKQPLINSIHKIDVFE